MHRPCLQEKEEEKEEEEEEEKDPTEAHSHCQVFSEMGCYTSMGKAAASLAKMIIF